MSSNPEVHKYFYSHFAHHVSGQVDLLIHRATCSSNESYPLIVSLSVNEGVNIRYTLRWVIFVYSLHVLSTKDGVTYYRIVSSMVLYLKNWVCTVQYMDDNMRF